MTNWQVVITSGKSEQGFLLDEETIRISKKVGDVVVTITRLDEIGGAIRGEEDVRD